MRTFIQKLGKSMMGPLSLIVAAGLLLGLVSILTNANLVGEGFATATGVQAVVGAVSALVGKVFNILPILFAISIATGMVKEDKEYAAFAVVICFVLFHVMINYLLSMNGITADNTAIDYLTKHGSSTLEAYAINSKYDTQLGIFTYRMGIFGGIITGLWTAFIHDKFHTQKLPVAFSFFAGNRFVPIMVLVTVPFVAIVAYFVWPLFSILTGTAGAVHADPREAITGAGRHHGLSAHGNPGGKGAGRIGENAAGSYPRRRPAAGAAPRASFFPGGAGSVVCRHADGGISIFC